MKKLAYIDALRGIAVFGVLLVHCGQQVQYLPITIQRITLQGQYGVMLFYIISALTLFVSLYNRKSLEKHLYYNFFIRRFFRIAPLFYFAILFWIIYDIILKNYFLGTTNSCSIGNIISHIVFLNGLSPYWINSLVRGGWSIAVEMMFYLFVPFLFIIIKNVRHSIIFALFSFLISFTVQIFISPYTPIDNKVLWNEYIYYWFPNQLPIFSLGILLFFIIFNNGGMRSYLQNLKNGKNISMVLFFVAFLLLFAFCYVNSNIIPKHYLFGFAFCILIFSLAIHPLKIIVNKFWCFIGKISFSMYLTHFVVLEVVTYVTRPLIKFNFPTIHFLVYIILTLSITICISLGTFKFIEQPFQTLGKKIINNLEHKFKLNKKAINM